MKDTVLGVCTLIKRQNFYLEGNYVLYLIKEEILVLSERLVAVLSCVRYCFERQLNEMFKEIKFCEWEVLRGSRVKFV